MSQTQSTNKYGSLGRVYTTGDIKLYSTDGLKEMVQPGDYPEDDVERFHSVAQQAGQERYGNDVMDTNEVRSVLYVNEACTHAVEFVYRYNRVSFEQTPRVKDLDRDHENVQPMAPAVAERYEHVVAKHPEVQG